MGRWMLKSYCDSPRSNPPPKSYPPGYMILTSANLQRRPGLALLPKNVSSCTQGQANPTISNNDLPRLFSSPYFLAMDQGSPRLSSSLSLLEFLGTAGLLSYLTTLITTNLDIVFTYGAQTLQIRTNV